MMRKLKRTKIAYLLIFVIALAFTSSLALHSFAATATGNTDIRVIVDGRELSFDVPPTIVSGRTLVPLRVIFEALGAEVRWDPATKTVFGSTADTTVKLTINSRNAFVNGSLIRIDAPAMIIKGRTLVPTRFIAESLGTDVEWKNDTRTVGITTPKAISFQDPNLEAVIRTKIKKPAGEIKTNDVAKIDVLDASNKKISNLEGIQYFTSIRELNLEGNNIKEISKLATLKSLSYLYISKNQITDISPLSSLVNLKILMLWMNQISDISALGGMRGLEGLDLSENQVFDISPLKNLTDLQNLNLWSNPIIDISPLKDHTSIKQLYLLSSSEDRIDQNLFDKFDQMQKKVKEITDSLIKPGMTDLDKEQILHDYLVTHIKYDKQNFINNTLPDDSHTAYGALIKNIAVCDGYARSFQILLNAVGIQSQMIIGDFNSLNGSLSTSVKNGENEIKWRHAWNIVKLDNKYYQVDVTADDPLTQDGSDIFNHQYFNISDRQMGADHQWDRSSYAPCVEDNKLFNLNAKESKNVIIADNAYYFIDPDGGIRKMQPDGSNDIKISDDKAIEIVLLGDYIYYINDSDGRSIYRIKTDGSEKSKLSDTKAWEIDGGGGSIYYIGNYKVNKLGPNGENQGQLTYDDVVSWIYVNDTNLYYKSFNFDSGARLEKADLNGGNAVQVVNDEPTGFDVTYNGRNVDYWYEHDEHILDGWIYYVNKYDSKSIYRAKLDGTEKVKICDDSVVDRSDIEISGNYIYYKNSKDGNKYYRVNMDGTNKQSLE